MQIPFYQVDAFAERVFTGNPAAVMPLEAWLPDAVMQAIAVENNLSETALFVPVTADNAEFHLRWFTPTYEIELCGHATLAAAAVIFRDVRPDLDIIRFQSMSGVLRVRREGDLLELDFPARPGGEVPVTDAMVEAFGRRPLTAIADVRLHLVFDSADFVRSLKPDLGRIAGLDPDAVGITAAGDRDGLDYVCRMFAPNDGIPEDPVTGSLQTTLAPYWAARLGKTEMRARQESQRGGDMRIRLAEDRVFIAGTAVFVIEGTFTVPEPAT
jgi:predicted PhzF superfamily epimerase YddE/YHI9